MANTFTFKVLTMDGPVYESEGVRQVSVSTEAGEITILPKHTPLLSLLKPGEMRILKDDGAEIQLAISNGFVEVRKNGDVVILADDAVRAEQIDIEKAREARMRAQKLLEDKERLSDMEYADVVGTLERELARIRVGEKYGGRK